ncbi:magnesium transporter [soil metagenome]
MRFDPRRAFSPTAAVAAVAVVLRHWRSERSTLRQGFSALGICVGVTIVAGVVLGAMEGLLESIPGLLVLVPAAVGMRGAIFGALGARLGTGMLTGQFTLVRKRSSFTGQNIEASLLLTLVTAVLSAVVARAAAALFGLASVSVWSLVVVSMVGAILSSAVVLLIVVLLARTAQRRSWDMDAIGTPIISASADITTLPALVAATLLLRVDLLATVLGVACALGGVAATVLGVRHAGDLVRRVVRESLPVLSYAAVVGILAGTVLSARLDTLVSQPALLVLIPPFLASCGAMGGILSARLSSQLHLGLVAPRAVPGRSAGLEGSLLVLFAIGGFTAVGVLTHLGSFLFGFASPGALALVSIALLAGLIAAAALFAVAYYAAAASFHFGLDPDNYGIPIVTSTMDFVGILCLVGAIGAVGVG